MHVVGDLKYFNYSSDSDLIFETVMPQIVMCGLPSSGKSTWVTLVADWLRTEKGKRVHVVREEELFRGEKNDILDGKGI